MTHRSQYTSNEAAWPDHEIRWCKPITPAPSTVLTSCLMEMHLTCSSTLPAKCLSSLKWWKWDAEKTSMSQRHRHCHVVTRWECNWEEPWERVWVEPLWETSSSSACSKSQASLSACLPSLRPLHFRLEWVLPLDQCQFLQTRLPSG